MQPRHQATWLSPALVPTTWKDKAQRHEPVQSDFLWNGKNSMVFDVLGYNSLIRF